VDQGNLTCADDGACVSLMDGLFTSDGTPQMPYWVMKDYSQMTGERLNTSSSGTNITALATKTDSAQQVQMLVGRHDECGPPPRPWLNGGVSEPTCPSFQAPKDSAVSASVRVAEPYALSQVKATVAPLPNSATQPDGSDPVPSAPSATEMTLSVSNGTVTIPLSNVGDGDAFSITLTPPLPGPAPVSSPQVGIPNQTDLFDVANNGAVEVRWVDGAGQWKGPLAISPPGLAPAGSHLAVSPQFGVPNQTDVFVVANNGATQALWVQGAGQWNGPLPISPTSLAPAGGALATSQQFGAPDQTDVFVVANNGATQVVWVQGAGGWKGPAAISPTSFATPGSHLAASEQFGIPNQTDVFLAANNGGMQVFWVDDSGHWQGPLGI
jgi:hypothetical protein